MIIRNPKVDLYLADGCGRCSHYATPRCKALLWNTELRLLREAVLECGLTEELKWSFPVYTVDGKNVMMVSAFKDYAALSFFKGVLMKDPLGVLVAPGENTQGSRVWKFTDVAQIEEHEAQIRAYIYEAAELTRSGAQVPYKSPDELELPEELVARLESDSALMAAFLALTPGRRRSFALFVGGAQQAATREARVEKCIPKIYAGKGFNEY